MKCTIISIDTQTILEKITEFEPDLITMSESTFCLLKETKKSGLNLELNKTNKIKDVAVLFNSDLGIGEFKLYKEIG